MSMDSTELAFTPAATPPPGVRPNFVDPEELHLWIVATAIISLFLMVLVLVLRIFTRAVVMKSIDWGDYYAFLGFVFSAAFAGCTLGITVERRGRHQWDMSISTLLQTSELEGNASIVYCIGIMFSKLSILLFFMKVFVPSRGSAAYWTNQLLIYVNGLFYVSAVVSLICSCIPRAKISDPTLPGRCIDLYLLFLITAVVNVVSDFFILVFPLWFIWHLQMPFKRKFSVSIVFATGLIALFSSIMRLHAASKLSNTSDKTWIVAQTAMWTMAEMTTVLLCGTFPILPKLARYFKDKHAPKTLSPAFAHLNIPSSEKSSGSDSELKHVAVVVVEHSSPELVPGPAWISARKPDSIHSPV